MSCFGACFGGAKEADKQGGQGDTKVKSAGSNNGTAREAQDAAQERQRQGTGSQRTSDAAAASNKRSGTLDAMLLSPQASAKQASSPLPYGLTAGSNTAPGSVPNLSAGSSAEPLLQSSATLTVPAMLSSAENLARAISLVQELNGCTTSDRGRPCVPKLMALLCSRLPVTWACLTCISSSAQHFQHAGAAYVPFHRHLLRLHPSFASMVTTRPMPAGFAYAFPYPTSMNDLGTASKSLTNASAAIEIHGGDVTPLAALPSLQSILEQRQTTPQSAFLREDASNLHELPPDWQALAARRALRSILVIPVWSSSGALQGSLCLATVEPVVWEEQWWYVGLQLLVGWASGVLTQHAQSSCIEVLEEVLLAQDLTAIGTAFVRTLPQALQWSHLGGVEARLALVSSRLGRALMYAAESTPAHDRANSARSPGWDKFVDDGSGPSSSGSSRRSGGEGGGGGDSGRSSRGKRSSNGSSNLQPPAMRTSGLSGSGTGGAGSPAAGGQQLSRSSRDVQGDALQLEGRSASVGILTRTESMGRGGGAQLRRHKTQRTIIVTQVDAGSSDLLQIGDPVADRSLRNTLGEDAIAAMAAAAGGLSAPKVSPVPIGTDRTLMMSALEAGDAMVVKDCSVYSARNRMMPPDLDLEGKAKPFGTLLLLPLAYRGRPMGCGYVFVRNSRLLPMPYWSELTDQLSRVLYTKLSSSLRAEWHAALADRALVPSAVPPLEAGSRSSAPAATLASATALAAAAAAASTAGSATTASAAGSAATAATGVGSSGGGSIKPAPAGGASPTAAASNSAAPPASSAPASPSTAAAAAATAAAETAATVTAATSLPFTKLPATQMSNGRFVSALSASVTGIPENQVVSLGDLGDVAAAFPARQGSPAAPSAMRRAATTSGSGSVADAAAAGPAVAPVPRRAGLRRRERPEASAPLPSSLVTAESSDRVAWLMFSHSPRTSTGAGPSLDGTTTISGSMSGAPPPASPGPSTSKAGPPQAVPAAAAAAAPAAAAAVIVAPLPTRTPDTSSGKLPYLSMTQLQVPVTGFGSFTCPSTVAGAATEGPPSASDVLQLRQTGSEGCLKAPPEYDQARPWLQGAGNGGSPKLPQVLSATSAAGDGAAAAVTAAGASGGASGTGRGSQGSAAGESAGAAAQGASPAAGAQSDSSSEAARPSTPSRRSAGGTTVILPSGAAVSTEDAAAGRTASPDRTTPNAPGSRTTQDTAKVAPAPHHPAISRVIKVSKLFEPYVNRKDRKKMKELQEQARLAAPAGDPSAATDAAPSVPSPERDSYMGDVGLCDSPSRASNIHTTSAGPADAQAVEGEGGAQGDALGGDGDEASSTQCENEPLPLDLQCWPDLVELTRCINVKRNAALYAGVLQGRQVALKVLSYGSSLDRHALPAQRHCELLLRLLPLKQPNLLRLLMVFPLVYEVRPTGGMAAARPWQPQGAPDGSVGPGSWSASAPPGFLGDGGAPTVTLSGVQPKRGKYRRCLALLWEYMPCVSLREVLAHRLLHDPAAAISGTALSRQLSDIFGGAGPSGGAVTLAASSSGRLSPGVAAAGAAPGTGWPVVGKPLSTPRRSGSGTLTGNGAGAAAAAAGGGGVAGAGGALAPTLRPRLRNSAQLHRISVRTGGANHSSSSASSSGYVQSPAAVAAAAAGARVAPPGTPTASGPSAFAAASVSSRTSPQAAEKAAQGGVGAKAQGGAGGAQGGAGAAAQVGVPGSLLPELPPNSPEALLQQMQVLQAQVQEHLQRQGLPPPPAAGSPQRTLSTSHPVLTNVPSSLFSSGSVPSGGVPSPAVAASARTTPTSTAAATPAGSAQVSTRSLPVGDNGSPRGGNGAQNRRSSQGGVQAQTQPSPSGLEVPVGPSGGEAGTASIGAGAVGLEDSQASHASTISDAAAGAAAGESTFGSADSGGSGGAQVTSGTHVSGVSGTSRHSGSSRSPQSSRAGLVHRSPSATSRTSRTSALAATVLQKQRQRQEALEAAQQLSAALQGGAAAPGQDGGTGGTDPQLQRGSGSPGTALADGGGKAVALLRQPSSPPALQSPGTSSGGTPAPTPAPAATPPAGAAGAGRVHGASRANSSGGGGGAALLPTAAAAGTSSGGGAGPAAVLPGVVSSRANSGALGSSAAVPNVPLLCSILAQVAGALQAIHRAGLLHGELRAENVLVVLTPPPGSAAPLGARAQSGPLGQHRSSQPGGAAGGGGSTRPSVGSGTPLPSTPEGAVPPEACSSTALTQPCKQQGGGGGGGGGVNGVLGAGMSPPGSPASVGLRAPPAGGQHSRQARGGGGGGSAPGISSHASLDFVPEGSAVSPQPVTPLQQQQQQQQAMGGGGVVGTPAAAGWTFSSPSSVTPPTPPALAGLGLVGGGMGSGLWAGPPGLPYRQGAQGAAPAAAPWTPASGSSPVPPWMLTVTGGLRMGVQVKLKDAGLCSLQVVTGQAQPAVRKLVGRLRNIPLPPEVLQGQRPRRAADVWAFGHLMWELCTGHPLPPPRLTEPADTAAPTSTSPGGISSSFNSTSGIGRPLKADWPADVVPRWYKELAELCWAPNPKHRPSLRRIIAVLRSQGDVGLADGSPSDLNAAPAGSLDQQVEHQQQQAAAGTAFAGSAAGAGPSKAAAPAMSASRQREANLTGFL